jgi:hypothetical protein
MTELKKIAALAGQGGLFRISTPLKNGVLLESLDDTRTRVVAGSQSRVSVLSEISMYTLSADGSVPLGSVLAALHTRYGAELPVTTKSDAAGLRKLLTEVLPDADFDRVYVSDIKKLVGWYQILLRFAPEVFGPAAAPTPEPETGEAVEAAVKTPKSRKKENKASS